MNEQAEQSRIPEPFVLNVQKTPEISDSAEITEALSWYRERVALLPEMKVAETPVTDGDKWKAEMASNGEVARIVGAQFRVEGRNVSTTAFSWAQPIIEQRTEQATSPEGLPLEISGIVILVRNSEGKVLLTVVQEPGADALEEDGKEVHPSVRTPLQSSVQKLKDLAEGKEKVDETMKLALSVLVSEGRTFADVVRELPLKKVATDGNRIHSNVYYGSINVDEQTAQMLEEKTGGKFLSKEQINALDTVNGHTHIALSVTQ